VTPSRSSPSSKTPRDTPARVPLWREAIEVETTLRPTVPVVDQRRARAIPGWTLAFSLLLTCASAVVGAVALYRLTLERARLSRPPLLRGDPIAALPELLRPRIIEASWLYSVGAIGCALVLWLLLLALPSTRRFALHWAIVPGVLGVAGWLGAQWWFLLQS